MSLHSIAVEKWRSYELLQSTLDAIEDPIFVKDLQHRWIVFNTAFSKMVGKSSGKKFAGRLIPGFAIAFNSVVNRRDTNALAKRAIAFYGG